MMFSRSYHLRIFAFTRRQKDVMACAAQARVTKQNYRYYLRLSDSKVTRMFADGATMAYSIPLMGLFIFLSYYRCL